MINRLSQIIVLALVLLCSCDYRPLSVLSEEKMKEVLVDVHLAESTLKVVGRGKNNSEKQAYIASVYTKHGITKEDFDVSVDWYSRHPEEYMLIYENVHDSLKGYESMVENYVFHPEEKPTYLDSIDTINIWQNNKYITYTNPKYRIKRKRQLDTLNTNICFRVDDTLFFSEGDLLYQLKYIMRLYDNDSLIAYNANFYMHRTDSLIDTISTCVMADSIERIYTLTFMVPDSVKARELQVELLDTVNEKSLIDIDSISLYKVYEYYDYPLPRNLQMVVDSIAGLNVTKRSTMYNRPFLR